jgi:hypothetical protein
VIWRIVLSCAWLLTLAERVPADEPTRCVQEELRRRNLYFGEIDGRTNDELRGALRRYQERKNLHVTGDIDQDTARSLNVPGAIATRASAEEWPDVPVLKSDSPLVVADTDPIPSATGTEASPVALPPAPAESPTGLQEITPPQVANLVEKYLRDAETEDINLQVQYYTFPVRYFDHGPVGRDFVVRDTTNYVNAGRSAVTA